MSKASKSYDDALLNADKFLDVVFRPVFPYIKFERKSIFGGVIPPNSFKGKILKYQLFDKTQYSLNKDDELLHFTSLQGLDAILESGYLRLSSIENLSDNLELSFALENVKNKLKIPIDETEIQNIKQNVFCLSSCLYNNDTIRDPFMWEIYSKGGSGAAIVFEVENINSNVLLGKVQYGEKELSGLFALLERMERYSLEYDNFLPNNLYEMMSDIFCFHKSNNFHRENEIRLLVSDSKSSIWDKHNNLFIEEVINSSNQVRYIYKLVLKERLEDWYNKNYFNRADISLEDVHNELPKIKIKEIIVGYNVKELNTIIPYLYEKKQKLNMDFDIKFLNSELEIRN
ncbi:DUF2971 domain-containing protein [Flavobacterium sp.]|uniref:DUF2971 domain-containing protein n=1 Tax=Flavobacterium sp. TaxID=239 RepID=UPI00374D3369